MSLVQALSNLWAWLSTWLDERGGVHSYIVHHHRDNLKILSPDTWTQAPCILGLLRIYQKTGNKKWLGLAVKLCDYLVETYQKPLHVYKNSNHERKPLGRPEIIHNAIASYALLEVAKEIKNQGEEWHPYYKTAKDNVENFLLKRWDENIGSPISFYHGKPSHIHNMSSATILAFAALSEIEEKEIYIKKYCKKIGRYILYCQIKKGKLAGAYPYVNTLKSYRTLYTLITCLGLAKLYEKTNNREFLVSVSNAAQNLSNFIDPQTSLICHFHRKGYPQWVPDTLLFIRIVEWLKNQGVAAFNDSQRIMQKVLSMQYRSGGFPLSLGFEDLHYKRGLPSKPQIKRWRDVLPTPNWNAWNFWMLSELLPKNSHPNEPNITFPFTLETDKEEKEGPYRIIEDLNKVTFIEKERENVVGIFVKKSDVADFCLIEERSDYWRTITLLNKYPTYLRKLILKLPNL
jgi:hypothetical protein